MIEFEVLDHPRQNAPDKFIHQLRFWHTDDEAIGASVYVGHDYLSISFLVGQLHLMTPERVARYELVINEALTGYHFLVEKRDAGIPLDQALKDIKQRYREYRAKEN